MLLFLFCLNNSILLLNMVNNGGYIKMLDNIFLINTINWSGFDAFKGGWFGSGNAGKFYNGPTDTLTQEGWNLIKFYMDNNHWLKPEGNWQISFWGSVQNGVYALFHALTDVATMMMTGSLYLFKIIPDQLIHSDGSFHKVFLGVLGVGFALMTISMMIWLLGYLRGKRENEMTQVFTQIGVAAGSIILLPIIVGFLANMVVGYLIPSVSGINQSSSALSLEPLKSNTIDMVTWAERGDGFGGDPDHSDLTKFNGIGKSSAASLAIPDYTTVMDSTQKTAVKQYAEESGNGNLKGLENVFDYELANGSFIDNNGDVKEGYGLEKLKEEKGALSALGTSYKRYKVQNLIAIISYLALIFTAFGMSIKVAKAAMNGLGEFIAMPLAMGRDIATSGEHGKKSLMMIINTVLGVVVDVFMLGLFVELQSTIPNQVADYLGSMHNIAATTAKPYGYLLTLVVLCFAIYNGSSAIERTFGLDNGANGMHKPLLPMFTAGAMLGASLKGAGSRIGDAIDSSKMKKLTEDKTKEEAGGVQNIVNNGKALASRLSEVMGMNGNTSTEDTAGGSDSSDEETNDGQVNNGAGVVETDVEGNGNVEDSFGPNSPDPIDASTTESDNQEDGMQNHLENDGLVGDNEYESGGNESNYSESPNNQSLENTGRPDNMEPSDNGYSDMSNDAENDNYTDMNMKNDGKNINYDDKPLVNDSVDTQSRNGINDESRVNNRTESHTNESRQQPNNSRTVSGTQNTSTQLDRSNLTEDQRREMNRLEQRRQMRARNRQERKQVQSGRRHRMVTELVQANEAMSKKTYQEPRK